MKAALGVVLVRVGSKSVVFRKGAPCPLVAGNMGPAAAFPGFSLGALCHGWLIPLVGFSLLISREALVVNPRIGGFPGAPAGVEPKSAACQKNWCELGNCL